DQRGNLGILAALHALIVVVVSLAGLATQALLLAQQIGYVYIAGTRVAAISSSLTHAHGDIQPGQVGYRKGTHGETEALHCCIDLGWQGTLFEHEFTLLPVSSIDSIADEAESVIGQDRQLAQALR